MATYAGRARAGAGGLSVCAQDRRPRRPRLHPDCINPATCLLDADPAYDLLTHYLNIWDCNQSPFLILPVSIFHTCIMKFSIVCKANLPNGDGPLPCYRTLDLMNAVIA